jgi:hypothetical protein
MLGNYRLAMHLVAVQVALSSIELVNNSRYTSCAILCIVPAGGVVGSIPDVLTEIRKV